MKRGMIAIGAFLTMALYGSEYSSFENYWLSTPEYNKYIQLSQNGKIDEAMKIKKDVISKFAPLYLKDYLDDFRPEVKDEYLGYINNLLPMQLNDLLKELHKKSKKYINSSDIKQKHQFVKHLYNFIYSYYQKDGKTTKTLKYLIKFVPEIKNAEFIPVLENMAKYADTEAAKTPEQKQKEYDEFIEATDKRIEANKKEIEANRKEIAIWNKIIEDLNALPDVKLLDK